MRLALDPRARRLLRRVPRSTIYSAMELLLLSLLALQCARLVWTLVTPVDPIGEWKTSSALRPVAAAAPANLGNFDPFFRASGSNPGTVVVTSLNLSLFGVREDRASGRGSAIIGTPEGVQRSFAVGEEIIPGVRLTAVGFDNVTIDRGGTPEQIFLDQSQNATVVGPGGAPANGPPLPPTPVPTVVAPPPPPPANPVAAEIQFQPQIKGGQIQGVTVQPQGRGEAFRAAGFAPGDVITTINGQRITSAEQARELAGRLGGSEVSVEVNRGGRTVPLMVRVPR